MAQFALPTMNPPVVSTKQRKKRDSAPPPKRKTMPTGRPSKLDRLSLDIMYMVLICSSYITARVTLNHVLQILRQLEPKDLLNLIQTNKTIRGVLLSRRSKHVWRRVLASPAALSCPSCPEDMPEPAWANLVFGEARCTVCPTIDA